MKNVIVMFSVLILVLSLCVSCSQEPETEYKVGDKGPAGGYVFYDKGKYSHGWRYLEAAPADLRVVNGTPTVDSSATGYSGAAPQYQFGFYRLSDSASNVFVNGGTSYNATECTKADVGEGKRNTQLLVSAMGSNAYSAHNGSSKTSNYAARLCDILTYTVDGKTFDDWFLPSNDELFLMYENLGYNDLGGFDDDDCYWSSSEYTDASYAIQKYFGSGAFGTGRERSEYFRVRPARAF